MATEPADKARPEQTFFEDPALDRAFGMVMALATEVYVLRDRVRALETALAKSGAVDPAALARIAAARCPLSRSSIGFARWRIVS